VTKAGFGPEPTESGSSTWGAAFDLAERARLVREYPERLKDSGERRSFLTGAVRDAAGTLKPRHDLIPVHAIVALGHHMRRGAAKYADRNWEKGMPLSVFFNSAMNHMLKFVAGYDDEPHLDAAIWNLTCLAEGRTRIAEGIWDADLDDIPRTFAGKEPSF